MSPLDSRPDVDLIDGRFYGGDPHAAWSWMRVHEPIYHDTRNDLWAITRHEDVMAISKDSVSFCNGGGSRPDSPPTPMMINMDRPEHMIRRNLVNRGFTPRRVSELEPRVRAICGDILDTVCERGSCDFVSDVAAPLPMIVIGDLLGVEPEDRDHLLRWSDVMVTAVGSPDPDAMANAAQAMAEYTDYNRRVVAERRREPGDDLISILVGAEIDGQRLDDDSILYESLLILVGGDETTRHVISGGMEQLLRHPDQFRTLVREPAGIPLAVEEMLRWVSPIQNMMRTATRPARVGGHRFQEGDRMLLMYPSANRDEAVFERPAEFEASRQPNPHVAFGGYGSHFCLGNSLARLELRVMFEELLARFPDLALASEEPLPRRQANFIVGLESLPVRFRPSPRGA